MQCDEETIAQLKCSEEAQKTKWGYQRNASRTFNSYKIWFAARDRSEMEDIHISEGGPRVRYILQPDR